jgi:hypothetical protein
MSYKLHFNELYWGCHKLYRFVDQNGFIMFIRNAHCFKIIIKNCQRIAVILI